MKPSSLTQLLCYAISFITSNRYAGAAPSWDELDSRPLPAWYDDAKFGIFLHWGVFSVPAYGSEWFWYSWKGGKGNERIDKFVNVTEKPGFTYQEYASRFTAELYKPAQWANAFANSGAQYVVLTSKHHEGFCNWNSKDVPTTWNWNVMDIGPKRDILGDLAVEVRKQASPFTAHRLKFGVYHSLYEWFSPMYQADKASNFTTQHFVDTKTIPELYDLVNKYAPEIIWSDGEWEAHSDYWKSREFLHWYASNSSVASTAVWNDRWGTDTICKHGGFLTCSDRFNPGKIQERKWEDALTIDRTSWGLNRNASITDYMTVKELVHTLIEVVAFNGNVLLNIGPGKDGIINPIFFDRLRGMGDWLKVNGEAIYGTKPWQVCQNETNAIFYTKKDDRLYAHFTKWPEGNRLDLHCVIPSDRTQVHFLGLKEQNKLEWTDTKDNVRGVMSGIRLTLPALTPDILPCEHAWVVVITGIGNF